MIYEQKKIRTLGLSDMYEGLNQDFRIFKKKLANNTWNE
jgi:hypothetical protein